MMAQQFDELKLLQGETSDQIRRLEKESPELQSDMNEKPLDTG